MAACLPITESREMSVHIALHNAIEYAKINLSEYNIVGTEDITQMHEGHT